MKLSTNLLAGLANSICSALIGLGVVPFYLKYLGTEAFGLIGFFATTQALFQILDMGFASTINREVARSFASENPEIARQMLHTLAIIYWSVAAAIALLIAALSPLISEYWLHSKHLPQETISNAVVLIGLVVACRWPIGLYQGVLIGAQRLAIYSAINIGMITFASVGAVAMLAFVSPTIEVFFIWQACMGLVHAVTIRSAAWKIIGKRKHLKFHLSQLKTIWRFSAGMSGIGLTALAFTQTDKVILSTLLGLEEYGHYMLATVAASSLYVLVSPLFNALYPRFSALVVTGETEILINLYRLGTNALATVLFPIAMVIAVFPEDLVYVWTGNPSVASSVAPIISMLVIGSALNGVMHLPYALQLAYGKTWIPLLINIVLMCFMLPLLIFLTNKFGALGGAMAWLMIETAYIFVGSWLTHRYILNGLWRDWLLHDVGIPLVWSVLIGLLGYYVTQTYRFLHWEMLLGAVGLAVFAAISILLTSQPLLTVTMNFARRKLYANKRQ